MPQSRRRDEVLQRSRSSGHGIESEVRHPPERHELSSNVDSETQSLEDAAAMLLTSAIRQFHGMKAC